MNAQKSIEILKYQISMNEVTVTRFDYTKLNAMIMKLLESNDSSIYALNSLNIKIKEARIADDRKIEPDCCTMNSTVSVLFPDTGKLRSFCLVYPEDVSLMDINLSVLTPLGCALLGSRKGQTVSVHAPEGYLTVIVMDLNHPSE